MTVRVLSDDDRRRRLAVRHRLVESRRTDDIAAIADDLVALHSSDPATVYLSAAVRMATPSVTAIDAALYSDRSVLRHHAMRRTLWVMTPPVAQRAHASSGRKVAAAERRTLIKRLDASPDVADGEAWLDDALTAVVGHVADAGSAMTRDIGEQLPELKIPLAYPAARGETVDVMAHTKVAQLAGFEGRIVRTSVSGSWVGSQYRWAPTVDWLPEGLDAMDTRTAAGELLHNWLERFGPGTENDLVWWTGWTKTAVRTALSDIDAQSVQLESGESAWLASGDDTSDPESSETWVAVLPSLDPTIMGWKGRSWYLDDDVASRVFDRNGNAGPTIMVNGRVVGGWVQREDGTLAHELLRPLTTPQQSALDLELNRVRTFIGDTRFRVRFPSPNQRELLA